MNNFYEKVINANKNLKIKKIIEVKMEDRVKIKVKDRVSKDIYWICFFEKEDEITVTYDDYFFQYTIDETESLARRIRKSQIFEELEACIEKVGKEDKKYRLLILMNILKINYRFNKYSKEEINELVKQKESFRKKIKREVEAKGFLEKKSFFYLIPGYLLLKEGISSLRGEKLYFIFLQVFLSVFTPFMMLVYVIALVNTIIESAKNTVFLENYIKKVD